MARQYPCLQQPAPAQEGTFWVIVLTSYVHTVHVTSGRRPLNGRIMTDLSVSNIQSSSYIARDIMILRRQNHERLLARDLAERKHTPWRLRCIF